MRCHTIYAKLRILVLVKIIGKVLSLLEGCFDLNLSPSPFMEITENMGFESRSGRSKIDFPFSFHFQILHTKLGIFEFGNVHKGRPTIRGHFGHTYLPTSNVFYTMPITLVPFNNFLISCFGIQKSNKTC